MASAVFGLWIGGYPGAVLLPVASAGFMLAIALREDYRFPRLLASPWLVAVAMLAAAVSGGIGEHLTAEGSTSSLASSLSGSVPQLLCVILVGRLIAALLLSDTAPPRHRDAGVAAGRQRHKRRRDRSGTL